MAAPTILDILKQEVSKKLRKAYAEQRKALENDPGIRLIMQHRGHEEAVKKLAENNRVYRRPKPAEDDR